MEDNQKIQKLEQLRAKTSKFNIDDSVLKMALLKCQWNVDRAYKYLQQNEDKYVRVSGKARSRKF